MVDTLDDVNALMEMRRLKRGDPKIRSLLPLMAVTGPYAMLGAAGALQRQCGTVMQM